MLANKYFATTVGAALAIVLAYNLNFFLSRSEKGAAQAVKPQILQPVLQKPPVAADEPATARPMDPRDDGAWKRDPFATRKSSGAPVDPPPVITDDITLGGIIRRDGRGYALINGKVYGVNDQIGNVLITDIRRHSILLRSNGRTEEISFEDYKALKEKKK